MKSYQLLLISLLLSQVIFAQQNCVWDDATGACVEGTASCPDTWVQDPASTANGAPCLDCTKTSGWTSDECAACDPATPEVNSDASACQAAAGGGGAAGDNCTNITTYTDAICAECFPDTPVANADATGCEVAGGGAGGDNCTNITNYTDAICAECFPETPEATDDATGCQAAGGGGALDCANITFWNDEYCQQCNSTDGEYGLLDGSGCGLTNCTQLASGNLTNDDCLTCGGSGNVYVSLNYNNCTSVDCQTLKANKQLKDEDCQLCVGDNSTAYPDGSDCVQILPSGAEKLLFLFGFALLFFAI